MTGRRLTLHAGASGIRVDRYVAEHSQLSRSAITRLAREGHVRIGDAPVEAGRRVRRGDEIVVDIPPDAPALSLEAEDIPIDVLYEDRDVIVVNKPADLVVHPAYGHSSGTLVNALVARIAAQSGREAARPGIVHRLDKDTSGVMIIAKNDVAQLALARQLQGRTVRKEYLALVWGDPGAEPAVVEAPLLRDPGDRRRMAVRAGGRDATTRFRRIAAYGGGQDRQALLHVVPLTGRTHQIRAHLAFARTPIVGDPVYGRRGDRSGLGRQFLHAWRLTVRLPHAGERTFTAPLAGDLRAYLGSLGQPAVTAAPFGEVA
ncbi:MAG: RluA family pseudouridine synthase [Chloroflexi bacterium]|nr:RluA family pseudouridine synthase [Chloroflexota bacterium]MBI2983329.1 RluA family pseudouridine synthase [Chloroflexota bacterium]